MPQVTSEWTWVSPTHIPPGCRPGWSVAAHWPGSLSKVTCGHHYSGLAWELPETQVTPSTLDLGPNSGQKGKAQRYWVGP